MKKLGNKAENKNKILDIMFKIIENQKVPRRENYQNLLNFVGKHYEGKSVEDLLTEISTDP